MDYAVWNTLHDGSIESISGQLPGDISVRVDISYLCAKLPTSADYIIVCLRGCRLFEFHPYEGDAIRDLRELEALCIEVLSARIKKDTLSVVCTDGFLKLAYERAEISLAEGTHISQAELFSAAERYWAEWSNQNRRK